MENILSISDLNFIELIKIGLIYGFITSLTVGLLSLAIYYSIKLFNKV